LVSRARERVPGGYDMQAGRQEEWPGGVLF
jgi:hypothetical protein